jgi:hypothetical protein
MGSVSVAMLLALGAAIAMWIIASGLAFKQLKTDRINHTLTQRQTVLLTGLATPPLVCVGVGKFVVYLSQWLSHASQNIAIATKSSFKVTVRTLARLCTRPRSRRAKRSPGLSRLEMPTYVPAKPASFLGIPAEARNKIYSFVVEHYNSLDCRPNILLRPRKQFLHAMALIHTCRQIRDEAHLMVLNRILFNVWTRYPFYRQVRPVVLWNEIRTIHLVAQINSHGFSRIAGALQDIRHMFGLRDLYITIHDFGDFDTNHWRLLSVFSLLRHRLHELKHVQLNIQSAIDMNTYAERRLKRLLVNTRTNGAWPVDVLLGVSRTLLSSGMTRWMGFARVPNYDVELQIGVDEDLVRLPWDGYTY